MKNILILNGHPDAGNQHYCDVIVKRYTSAATAAGHTVNAVNVNDLVFDLLGSKQQFDDQNPCEAVADLQRQLLWANHFVVVYPLWLGGMPALLKGLFEQLFRPGFAVAPDKPGKTFKRLLNGKSARIFVTMGMPGAVYKWFFRAHTLKSLKRNVLDFAGFKPVRSTVIGSVYEGNEERLKESLSNVSKLGQLAR